MSRASYARSRRNQANSTPESTGPSVVRTGAENVAKRVYQTFNPAVESARQGATDVIKSYLKGTQSSANKIKPYLPNAPKRPTGRRPRKQI